MGVLRRLGRDPCHHSSVDIGKLWQFSLFLFFFFFSFFWRNGCKPIFLFLKRKRVYFIFEIRMLAKECANYCADVCLSFILHCILERKNFDVFLHIWYKRKREYINISISFSAIWYSSRH